MSRTLKLGKLPVRHDKRTLLLAAYLAASLPPAPEAVDYSDAADEALQGKWGMMANDQIGDCTCATAGHFIQAWEAEAGKDVASPSDKAIIDAYRAVSGYNPKTGEKDRGAIVLDVLNYWRKQGIAGHKICAFAKIQPGNYPLVKQAANLFTGLYLGLALPASASDQIDAKQTWDVPATGPTGAGRPGSWGGHAVPLLAYDPSGLTVVTWGGRQRMTWNFFGAYCDEAYAILSKDQLDGKGNAPAGFDYKALAKDLEAITK